MHAIGVDIGGTKIAAGVVDEDGTILAQTRRDTVARRRRRASTRPSPTSTPSSARSYEIGADRVWPPPGSSPPTGPSVLFAPNIAWRDYPLRERSRRSSATTT